MAGFKNNRKLTVRQEQALRALVVYPSVRAAAQAVHVPERTVYRWMAQREFRAKLEEAEDDPLGATRARTNHLSGEALSVLQEIMKDRTAETAARIQAATTFLRYVAPSVAASQSDG
ncbi:MAG: hypothetical protein GC160_08380 [Acidobacteria bacterium]|nr:hypothetical protein [Acidobacteriota bacterium]